MEASGSNFNTINGLSHGEPKKVEILATRDAVEISFADIRRGEVTLQSVTVNRQDLLLAMGVGSGDLAQLESGREHGV